MNLIASHHPPSERFAGFVKQAARVYNRVGSCAARNRLSARHVLQPTIPVTARSPQAFGLSHRIAVDRLVPRGRLLVSDQQAAHAVGLVCLAMISIAMPQTLLSSR